MPEYDENGDIREIMPWDEGYVAPVPDRQCKRCLKFRPPHQFNTRSDGSRTVNCTSCCEAKRLQERLRREEKRESRRIAFDEDMQGEEGVEEEEGDGCLEIGWDKLYDLLSRLDSPGPGELCKWVIVFGEADEFTDIEHPDVLARVIAIEMWEATGYRWSLRDRTEWTGLPDVLSFRYHCAQDVVHKKSRIDEEQRKRKRNFMPRWDCHGQITIRIDRRDMSRVFLKYVHSQDHTTYTDIVLPKDAVDYISANTDRTPSEIHAELRRKYAAADKPVHFTQKQVHARWTRENERVWKLDPDELTSASLVMQRHRESDRIDLITLPTITGVQAFAFAVRDVLEQRGPFIHEVGMDSTWKTNGMGFELYAFVAEANGVALPLLFMFVKTGPKAPKDSKTAIIGACLLHIKERCVNIKFALSDKDASEINAIRKALPSSRHQLCYWHVIKYLKDRLAENKKPRKYRPRKAHSICPDVRANWGPIVLGDDEQSDEEDDSSDDEEDARPASGVWDEAEEVTLHSVYSRVQERERLKRANRATDFCPLVHRGHIVAMHRTIMCMHPSIPSGLHNNRHLSAAEIYSWAVREMHEYCFNNDLVFAWAYLWNQWYQPKQWKLWARSASPLIPRIRTTMMVESLWRVIKRKYLIDFQRPRLDLAIHLILTNALPNIDITLRQLDGTFRVGREDLLANWQMDLKAEWEDMSLTDVQRQQARQSRSQASAESDVQIHWDRQEVPEAWAQDMQKWTCSCPAYTYSRFLLCKHLVRKANVLIGVTEAGHPLPFFTALQRYHSSPFWRIPGVHDVLPDPARTVRQLAPQRSGMRLSTRTRSGYKGTTQTPTVTASSIEVIEISDDENDEDDDRIVRHHARQPINLDDNIKPYTQQLAGNLDGPASAMDFQVDEEDSDLEADRPFRCFTTERVAEVKEFFDLILAEMDPEEMHHPRHADQIEAALEGVEILGRALKRAGGERRRRTTFGDWDPQTSFRSR
ncbi:hypothetical protein QFC21_001552 [Naganishia friedmannii]|uniref:Uncharacterized protein n=1 Tax=Naganishia friedmannii TaxID=89922 RepID=A0ACC2W6B7_9TREE|nr:hypothetical protein QFC21_001552 [Naganishia friedmannii]